MATRQGRHTRKKGIMAFTVHDQVSWGKIPLVLSQYDFNPKNKGQLKIKGGYRWMYVCLAAGGVALVCLITVLVMALLHLLKTHEPTPTDLRPSPTPHFQKWRNSSRDGITMYPRPEDGTVLIKYNARDTGNGGYLPYLLSLEYQLHAYHMMNQQGPEYTVCSNRSNVPANKVCKFELSVLKPCDHFDNYGYPDGRPCVMLQLNLPRNVTAVPFDKDSDEAKKLGPRYDPHHIGVTCDGLTEVDRRHMETGKPDYAPIDYFPKEGFPAWWFRPRTIDKFLAPIVMVRFNALQDLTYVRIKCTAWGQNFNDGKPDNSTLYSSIFAINHI